MSDTKLLERQPPKVIVKIANLVFISGIVGSFLIVFFSVYRIAGWWGIQQIPKLYVISFLACVISALLFSFGLRLKESVKVNVALVIVSSTVSLMLSETYLAFKPSPSPQERVTAAGLHDQRSKIQVIDDLRLKEIDAYPNVSGSQFFPTDGLSNPQSSQSLYPLGAISKKTIVYCNESGLWSIYESDEHGFNNPRGLYLENNVEIMLTGDSFAEGACVNPDQTIAAVLRESGFNVISLGKGGNGSLLEFASLKEYAVPLQPKVVLWIHYANDITDLNFNEIKSSFLMNYLADNNFSQNLMSRQDEIDDLLKDYIDRKYREQKIEIKQNTITKEQETNIGKDRGTQSEAIEKVNGDKLSNVSSVPQLIEILKLTNLRVRLGLKGATPSLFYPASTPRTEAFSANSDVVRPNPSLGEIFKTILMRADRIVSGWDGKLYFVWLHARERYEDDYEWPGYFREQILGIVTELNIPVIDAHKEVFASHADPLSLFSSREARHYNSEGYRRIAKTIAKRLKGDGLFQ